MLLHLKKIEDLLKDEPRLAPIAEQVSKTAQELTDASWGGSGSSQAVGEMERNLAKLEELLLQRLSALDQMQKLQQTPDEQIPPEFRDMAAKYFEALGASEAAPK
jgi:Mg2+ and Co2+ transporter CorA